MDCAARSVALEAKYGSAKEIRVDGDEHCGAGGVLRRPARRFRPLNARTVRLYVEPMDAVLVEVADDGRVRFENEGWSTPNLQETRAILYAARSELAQLNEVIEILERRG